MHAGLRIILMLFIMIINFVLLFHLQKPITKFSIKVWARMHKCHPEMLYCFLASVGIVGFLIGYIGVFRVILGEG